MAPDSLLSGTSKIDYNFPYLFNSSMFIYLFGLSTIFEYHLFFFAVEIIFFRAHFYVEFQYSVTLAYHIELLMHDFA